MHAHGLGVIPSRTQLMFCCAVVFSVLQVLLPVSRPQGHRLGAWDAIETSWLLLKSTISRRYPHTHSLSHSQSYTRTTHTHTLPTPSLSQMR